MLVLIHRVGILQVGLHLRQNVRCVMLRTRSASNVVGVMRLVQLQRAVFIPRDRISNCMRAGGLRIGSARQAGEVRVHLFQNTLRAVVDDLVLRNHQIAGHAYRKVRFSGHDHAERLQVGRYVQIDVLAARQHLAQVAGRAVRRDRPQHIRQVLLAEAVRRCQAVQIQLHRDAALLDVHFVIHHNIDG